MIQATHIITPQGFKDPKFEPLVKGYESGYVKCYGEFFGPMGDNEEQAIEKWNAIFTKRPKVYGYE